MKFRKKPVVVEAVQFVFVPERCKELADFLPDGIAPETRKDAEGYDEAFLRIPTLEGEMIANEGDWIIRGVGGEFYPCKDEIFSEDLRAGLR